LVINLKMKVYRYNELRSELVYRIELLQRAGLGVGTKLVRIAFTLKERLPALVRDLFIFSSMVIKCFIVV
jgi:hypothetical protein